MTMQLSPQGQAYQDFLLGAKTFLMEGLYPKARDAVAACGAADKKVTASRVESDADYAYFCWLEHYIQHFKYNARYGLAAEAERQRSALMEQLAGVDERRLDLQPKAVPAYYEAVDTHQHPGNLHADRLAGFIYKASAASTQPGSTDAYGLHYKFVDVLATSTERPRAVLDLGCGFGKSTLPIAQKWPQAAVKGIDLSEGCLRLAAREAEATQASNLSYALGDVGRLDETDETYDIVTSTMLLHELDTEALTETMREAYRVLAPGGKLVQLDFRARDPIERFFLHGHGQRNNEPYMAAFDEFDIEAYLRALGFTDIAIAPFEESPGAAAPSFPKWRLPWTVISAQKPLHANVMRELDSTAQALLLPRAG